VANNWTRILRAIGVFIAFVFFTTAFTPLSNYTAQWFAPDPALKRSEAIVVLGSKILRGGMLDNESLRRATYGIELYKKGLAPIIIFSGPHSGDDPSLIEAEARSKLASAMGVPSDAIFKEEAANTTREESIRISRTLAVRNIHRILLVTESLHMRRAKYVFERAGIEVFPAPSDNFAIAAVSPDQRLFLAIRIVQESIALAYYRLAGYI
jgi:uncharacterized SAM-binding protein YcdF (DUF218 family)